MNAKLLVIVMLQVMVSPPVEPVLLHCSTVPLVGAAIFDAAATVLFVTGAGAGTGGAAASTVEGAPPGVGAGARSGAGDAGFAAGAPAAAEVGGVELLSPVPESLGPGVSLSLCVPLLLDTVESGVGVVSVGGEGVVLVPGVVSVGGAAVVLVPGAGVVLVPGEVSVGGAVSLGGAGVVLVPGVGGVAVPGVEVGVVSVAGAGVVSVLVGAGPESVGAGAESGPNAASPLLDAESLLGGESAPAAESVLPGCSARATKGCGASVPSPSTSAMSTTSQFEVACLTAARAWALHARFIAASRSGVVSPSRCSDGSTPNRAVRVRPIRRLRVTIGAPAEGNNPRTYDHRECRPNELGGLMRIGQR